VEIRKSATVAASAILLAVVMGLSAGTALARPERLGIPGGENAGLLPLSLATQDTDGDGLSDADEMFLYGTNPAAADTDGDGLDDREEVTPRADRHVTNARAADSDGDGLSDREEWVAGSHPWVRDTDRDGIRDGAEAGYGTNPVTRDFDRDGVPDGLDTPITVAFSDDMEAGDASWAETGLWHQVTEPPGRASSPTHSWWYGQNATGDYDTGDRNAGSLRMVDAVVLPDIRPRLTFSEWHDTEDVGFDLDVRLVEVETGGVWVTVAQLGFDPMGTWNYNTIDLDAYAGQAVRVGFSFDTIDEFANDYEGWYVDDVVLGSGTFGSDPDPADTDGDGLSDGFEVLVSGTDPVLVDTDGDGLSDGLEVRTVFSDPLSMDTDADGLTDAAERTIWSTDPRLFSTDMDGISDGEEVVAGSDGFITDPLNPDTDGDALFDSSEIFFFGTDPTVPDTDAGGRADGVEVWNFFDPSSPVDDGDPLPGGDPDGDLLGTGPEAGTWGTPPGEANIDGDAFPISGAPFTDLYELGYLMFPFGAGGAWATADVDSDTIMDPEELFSGGDGVFTDPTVFDTDGDGISDAAELNPVAFGSLWTSHPRYDDTDRDGVGDGFEEFGLGTAPKLMDTDRDLWIDSADPSPKILDLDFDGLLDGMEFLLGTSPFATDSDGDGLSDGRELNEFFTDPLLFDTDGDGLGDESELSSTFTDPLVPDSDGDTLSDSFELFVLSTNPWSIDTDLDGLSDSAEITAMVPTNPRVWSTDLDGLS